MGPARARSQGAVPGLPCLIAPSVTSSRGSKKAVGAAARAESLGPGPGAEFVGFGTDGDPPVRCRFAPSPPLSTRAPSPAPGSPPELRLSASAPPFLPRASAAAPTSRTAGRCFPHHPLGFDTAPSRTSVGWLPVAEPPLVRGESRAPLRGRTPAISGSGSASPALSLQALEARTREIAFSPDGGLGRDPALGGDDTFLELGLRPGRLG